jgi:hypothetical protein
MSVVVAFGNSKFGCMASDSRIFIDGSAIIDTGKKIFKLPDGSLVGYTGNWSAEKRIVDALADYGDPQSIPEDRWPGGDYQVPVLHSSGKAYVIMGKQQTIVQTLPAFIYAGCGGDMARGAIKAILGRKRNLDSLGRRDVERIIRKAIKIVCTEVPECGGRTVFKWLTA